MELSFKDVSFIAAAILFVLCLVLILNKPKPGTKVLAFILFIFTIVAVVYGLYSDEVKEPENKVPEVSKNKTDAEVILEGGKELIKLGKEIEADISKKKQEKKRDFNLKKQQRWVYQIGDWISDDETIILRYNDLKHIEGIALFKDGRNFVFFKDGEYTQKELNDSMPNIKSLVRPMSVKNVNLMDYCENDKQKLKMNRQKFGKKKDKLLIDCYFVGK